MTWLDLTSEERKVLYSLLIMVVYLASEAGRAFCKLSPDPIQQKIQLSMPTTSEAGRALCKLSPDPYSSRTQLQESMHYCKGGQLIHLSPDPHTAAEPSSKRACTTAREGSLYTYSIYFVLQYYKQGGQTYSAAEPRSQRSCTAAHWRSGPT